MGFGEVITRFVFKCAEHLLDPDTDSRDYSREEEEWIRKEEERKQFEREELKREVLEELSERDSPTDIPLHACHGDPDYKK